MTDAVLKGKFAGHHGRMSWESVRREDRSYFFNMSPFGSYPLQVWQIVFGETVGLRIEKDIGAKAVYGDENHTGVGRVPFGQTAGQEESE